MLNRAAHRIAPLVDYYTIACNTLNFYQSHLEARHLPARFVSFVDVLIASLRASGARRSPGFGERFEAILGHLTCENAVLACTELPLIPVTARWKILIDPTDLMARELVRLARAAA